MEIEKSSGEIKEEKEGIESEELKKKSKDIDKKIGMFILIVVIAIIVAITVIAVRRTLTSPTFKYEGLTVNRFVLEGTNATFYSMRTPVKIYGNVKIYDILLRNDPRKLQDIEVSEGIQEKILAPKPDQFYFTFDPDAPEKGYIGIAMAEVSRVLGTYNYAILQIPVTGASTRPIEGFNESITCEDSSNKKVVVLFQYANSTEILVNESYERCIILQGKDGNEIIRAADKLVLEILGIG